MALKHRYASRVEWADCDPAGIVFYPHYFRWFDTGTHRMLEAAGIPAAELPDRFGALNVPLVDAHAAFKAPCPWRTEIEIESTISEWRGRTFVVSHAIYKDKGETLAVEGHEIRVWGVPHPDKPGAMKAGEIPDGFKTLFDEG